MPHLSVKGARKGEDAKCMRPEQSGGEKNGEEKDDPEYP